MVPKPTVFVTILFLLMVLIAGAHCSGRGKKEEVVILQSRCSQKFLRIENDGKVHTTNIYQNLTISIDNGLHVKRDLRFLIYSKQAKRYLCFTGNWTLVGLERIPENGRHRCQFYELRERMDGYSKYVSVKNKERAIGFGKQGNQLRNQKQRQQKCFMFFKCDTNLDTQCFVDNYINDSDSDSINRVNTGQSNSNINNYNNNKSIVSNNNNNNNKNNGNKNGKKRLHRLNKKSHQIPNMENDKTKMGVGKRGGKGKKRNINNIEKVNQSNNTNSLSNNSLNNYKQLEIYETPQHHLRHNRLSKHQNNMAMKRQQKLAAARSRPVRHSHHRNHHQTEDKIAQIFEENYKK